MKKRNENEKSCNCETTKEKRIINTIILVVVISIISVFTGGVVMLYKNIQEEKNAKPVIVSYEEGTELMDTINKLDTLDLLKKDFNKLSDEEFLFLVASMTEKIDDAYKVEDLNKTANKYFGRDIKIVKFKCLDCPDELYVYDETTNSYIYNENHQGHGTAYKRDVYNLFFSAKREGNLYYITVLKAFSNSSQTGCGAHYYYDSLEESNKIATLEYNMDNNCELLTDIDKEISNNKGKLNKYTYTFEKIDDNYILKGLELEN